MKKRELMEENRRLNALLMKVEETNKAYGGNLEPCRSGQCLGCKFSVAIRDSIWRKPILVGCSKRLFCGEYKPALSNEKKGGKLNV